MMRRTIVGAAWSYAGNFTRIVLQFVIGIVLARLLGPHAFGIVAIALLLVGIGQLFVDFGFSAAIVQARDLTDRDVDHLFSWQLASGAVMTMLGVALSVPIADFFGQPDAAPVIVWMSAMFVIRALGQTAMALLQRDMRFRSLQLINIASYVIGYVIVGVPMAITGHGVWSIVAAQLVQSLASAVSAMIAARRVPRLRWTGGRRDLTRFGGHVISANLGSWTVSVVGSVMVGHQSSATDLGLYDRAGNLAGQPMGAVVSGLQGVLFSATARAQDSIDEVRNALIACIQLYILTSGSVLCAVAASASLVLLAIYGPQWVPAAAFLTPLSIAMVIQGVLAFIGPTLMGVGRVDSEARAQWIAVAIMVPAVYVAALYSPVAVAWTVAGMYLLRLTLLTHALHRHIPLTAIEIVRMLLPPTGVALAAGAAALISSGLFSKWSIFWHLVVVIALSGAAAGLTFLFLVPFMFDSPLGRLLGRVSLLRTLNAQISRQRG